MRHRLAVPDDVRDQILAEIMARIPLGGVAPQFIEQEFGLEHVDAHAGERHVGAIRHAGGIGGLLQERDQPVLFVDMHHAEAGRLHARHLDAADGNVRAALDVELQHVLVVHLVDVIAGQDDDVLRLVGLDDVDVLIDRIRGAGVPLGFRYALARGQDVEAFIAFRAEEVPAALQVADQAVRFVLCRHADAADARIHCVGQREIDDARLAAEIDRGLGADVGQLEQPAAAAACQHIGHGGARERRADAELRVHRPVFSLTAITRSLRLRGDDANRLPQLLTRYRQAGIQRHPAIDKKRGAVT